MRPSWDLKTYNTPDQIGLAPYGKKLALLGLLSAALLLGAAVFALPMLNEPPKPQPEASISLKNTGGVRVQSSIASPSISVSEKVEEPQANVTVNGQDISVPANGSTYQIIKGIGGDIKVHTNSSNTEGSNKSSSSSLNISVMTSGNGTSRSEIIGGNNSINILTR